MNLLARILSHGFAIAIVLLLAIGLIYRGELFPDWELPEFLSLGTPTESGDTDAAGSIIPKTPAAEPVVVTTPASTKVDEPAAVTDTPVEMPAVVPAAPEDSAETAGQPTSMTEPAAPEATAPAAAVVTQAAHGSASHHRTRCCSAGSRCQRGS